MQTLLRTFCKITLIAFLLAPYPAFAAESQRDVIINQDSDYFGFDLRVEKDVSQAVCETICLSDKECRAFT
ncbi:MAG: hypothetical protein ACRCT6_06290, partial [Notoacmeibacter sp.]